MKRFLLFFISVGLQFNAMFAENLNTQNDKNQTVKTNKDETKEITMSALDAVRVAGKLVEDGNYNFAQQILIKMPQTNNLSVELERWFLLAQIEQKKGNVDEAIKIYRKILDDQPDLPKVRYELALCYMMKHQWYRADYHLRLAMAGQGIPDAMKRQMMYMRYIVRQNKRWNAWFNFGAAPDNNVNQASGGAEYIRNEWGEFQTELPEPEKAIGYNFLLGGNYEFVLSDHWHWKNEGNIYTNIYNKHKFDDLFVSASTGPRYIWEQGDVWLAAVLNRRWYGWNRYNWSIGGRIDTHYDWSRKFSSGLTFQVLNNDYDEYGEYMNGQTFSVLARTSYSFDASKYFTVFGGVDRDTATSGIYANWNYRFGIGIGGEFTYGFSVYLEPSFVWTNYDQARWAIKDYQYVKIRESDFTQRYSVMVSNNKIDILGFVPMVSITYTDKNSNIHSREYDKWTMEFTLRQRF